MTEHGIQPNKLKYLVFAGNFKEYRQWLENNDIPTGEALYIAHTENLMGYNDPNLKLVRVGTFHLRPDANEILNEVRYRFKIEQWVSSDPTS